MQDFTVPEAISRQLSPGEQVLWQGRPRQGILFRAGEWYTIPFSLVWCGVLASGLRAQWTHGASRGLSLWSLVFIPAGLYLLVGRFLIDAMQRKRTVYAVTRERVLIVSGLLAETVTSLPLATLADLTLRAGREDEGTILFGPEASFAWNSAGLQGGRMQSAPRLERIAGVRDVYELIRRVQRRENGVS